MAKTFLELIEQVKGILRPANGGTGLSSPGAAGNGLISDGAGNWTSAPLPTQNSFQLDGGAANTNYVGVAKIDLGSAS